MARNQKREPFSKMEQEKGPPVRKIKAPVNQWEKLKRIGGLFPKMGGAARSGGASALNREVSWGGDNRKKNNGREEKSCLPSLSKSRGGEEKKSQARKESPGPPEPFDPDPQW